MGRLPLCEQNYLEQERNRRGKAIVLAQTQIAALSLSGKLTTFPYSTELTMFQTALTLTHSIRCTSFILGER